MTRVVLHLYINQRTEKNDFFFYKKVFEKVRAIDNSSKLVYKHFQINLPLDLRIYIYIYHGIQELVIQEGFK